MKYKIKLNLTLEEYREFIEFYGKNYLDKLRSVIFDKIREDESKGNFISKLDNPWKK